MLWERVGEGEKVGEGGRGWERVGEGGSGWERVREGERGGGGGGVERERVGEKGGEGGERGGKGERYEQQESIFHFLHVYTVAFPVHLPTYTHMHSLSLSLSHIDPRHYYTCNTEMITW